MTTDESNSPQHPPSREQVIGGGVERLAHWTLRLLVVAAGAVLLGLAVGKLWSILFPVVLAIIVASVLQPPARWLERRLHLPSALSAAVVVLGTIGILVGIAALIAPSIAEQVGQVAGNASGGLTTIQDYVRTSGLDISNKQIDTVVAAAQERLQSSASSIASGVLVGVSAITSALVVLVLTLVLTFLFVKDGRRFLPWTARVAGERVGAHLIEVGTRSWGTLGGFIRTQALVGLIDATLIGLGLVIVGVPLAFTLSVLTFFAAFVPILGAFVIGGVAVLVALVSNGVGAALIILALILAVQQLEGNVLLPALQARSMNLPAAVILLAITLGSTVFGVTGAFLAVPVTAVGAVILRYLNEVVALRVRGSSRSPEEHAADVAARAQEPEPEPEPDQAG